MCGICGLVLPGGQASDELSTMLERMVDSLRHRGPDGRGQKVFASPQRPYAVGLGHTRLAILDLSAAGRQPMGNADESILISYNGEVYNFLSHRGALEQKGHRFRSQTDTEVLLHLYQEHGESFLPMLNGMFALAILDSHKRQLVLARDPLGIKPLYYYHSAGKFVFASEIKAILASGIYTTEVNWQSVYDYFTFLYTPCPQTIFRDIWQLPPGHVLKLDLDTGRSELSPYWQVRRLPDVETASAAELQERAEQLLAQAVSGQLISDVPLGIFLSGGIDSTIVAGLACEASRNVKTFTVVFEGQEFRYFNEQMVASAVSRHLGTEHHEITVPPTDLWSMLDLLDYFDQPFGNPTCYLMYLVSKHARDQITVALCGAGGDELYAGYPRYQAVRLARRLDWVPALLWRLGGRALDVFRDTGSTPLLRRARQFASGMPLENLERFADWTYFMGSAEKKRLLADRSGASTQWEPSDRVLRQVFDRSPLAEADNRLLHVDVRTFLVDNLLEYTDKRSKAVLAGLAQLLTFQDRHVEAVAAQRELLAKDPEDAAALNNLACYLALSGGDKDEALKLIDSAIAKVGPTATLLDSRGMILLELNRPQDAVRDLERAIEMAPNGPMYLHLAAARKRLNQDELSEAAIKQAHNLGLETDLLHPLERARYRELLKHAAL